MEGNLPNLSSDIFYAIAGLVSCAALALRNILWLRILLVISALAYIVSGVTLGLTPLVGWNTAFLGINLVHVIMLLLDKIAITLPRETREVYQKHFASLSPREFKELITSNGFCVYQDQNIISESEVPDRLFIVLRGKVNIIKGNETIATLKAGGFVGEMSFLSKEPASANAYAENFVQCAFWTHDDLEKLKQKNLDAYDKFIAIIGCDLVRKLNYQNERRLDSATKLDFVI
ncbi:MAG: cyclic nucleotide-binding domain-containing protein [Gammaproteobacteria bacterium]|nr:cyclic nucleotide-binding domain-containing protein [Gammaproteobacteria bacterium]